MQETWVWSLGWEGPLEKGKATYSSILARRILGGKELDKTERLSLTFAWNFMLQVIYLNKKNIPSRFLKR